MSRHAFRERIRELEEARSGPPQELETVSSPESARSAADQGLARAPFLRISDIMLLRDEGIESLDELEDRLLEVPDAVWPRVLDLIRARVIQVDKGLARRRDLGQPNGDGAGRCLALTKAGDRCQNQARSGSKYCASHKGYQPSEEELTARRQGLLPEA